MSKPVLTYDAADTDNPVKWTVSKLGFRALNDGLIISDPHTDWYDIPTWDIKGAVNEAIFFIPAFHVKHDGTGLQGFEMRFVGPAGCVCEELQQEVPFTWVQSINPNIREDYFDMGVTDRLTRHRILFGATAGTAKFQIRKTSPWTGNLYLLGISSIHYLGS